MKNWSRGEILTVSGVGVTVVASILNRASLETKTMSLIWGVVVGAIFLALFFESKSQRKRLASTEQRAEDAEKRLTEIETIMVDALSEDCQRVLAWISDQLEWRGDGAVPCVRTDNIDAALGTLANRSIIHAEQRRGSGTYPNYSVWVVTERFKAEGARMARKYNR